MTHRGTKKLWSAVIALLAVLALSACGGGDDDSGSEAADSAASSDDGSNDSADADNSSDGASDDADEESSSDAPAASDDDDFPIPRPDGLLLDALADAGITIEGQRQLFYDDDDFDSLVAFYDDWTDQNGQWARTEAEGMVIYQSLDSDSIRTISIAPEHDPGAQADGPVTFVLLVAER